MNFIIGIDDFGKAIQEGFNFVDKSLFIKEILDNTGTEVTVITRPRRFGKTLNMSMLHHFLAQEVNQLQTKSMFDHLKIAECGSIYMDHQGKYPVIFVSFKSISGSYAEGKESFQKLMSQLYGQHRVVFLSDTLYAEEKAAFERMLNQQASESDLTSALFDLSGYLYRYYGVKPWLLIDEYDTPIQSAYFNNDYEQMIKFMRGVFGSALKGNPHLHRAVVTGVLRISKESLFSGVNNLKTYSILNNAYAQHFGFTESEVDAMLRQAQLDVPPSKIKAWYNGYSIGDQQIYNPWSIVNCVSERGALTPYWVNTSGNELIKSSMASAGAIVKEKFERILAGEAIEQTLNEHMVFGDLKTNSDALWSLLLFSGYLTAIRKEIDEMTGDFNCLLQTPNQEVATLYRKVIQSWFNAPLGAEEYRTFLETLVTGQLDRFIKRLKQFLKESSSYFDTKGHNPEKFYHGFVLGLIVSLADTHIVQSNKESGDGRYDVMLIPKDTRQLGLILEFKVAEEYESLTEAATEALAQINSRGYETELRQKNIQKIVKVGLAFRDKDVEMMRESHEER